MQKQILITIFLIFSNWVFAQQYWMSIQSDYFFGASNEIITTSDGRYVSVGQHGVSGQISLWQTSITKFSSDGIILWQKEDFIFEDFLTTNIGVVEVKDHLYVTTTNYFSGKCMINRYDQDGNLISSSEIFDFTINEMLVNSEGKLIFQLSKGSRLFIAMYATNFEQIWEVELEDYLFDWGRGYGIIDDFDNYQAMLKSSTEDNMVTHLIINGAGEILKEEEFSMHYNINSQAGICFDYLDMNTVVILPQGSISGSIGPIEVIPSTQLLKMNVNTFEIIDSFDVIEYVGYSQEVIVIDDLIYFAGTASINGGPGILILDKELNFVDMIILREKLHQTDSSIQTADMYHLIDSGKGLAYCGTVFKAGMAHGYMSGHIGYSGECISSSVDDQTQQTSYTLFPNPSSDEMIFAFEKSVYIEYYRVFSASGRQLKEIRVDRQMSNLHIDIQSIEQGSIYIEVYTRDGIFMEKGIKI